MADFLINVGPEGTFRPSGKFHTTPQDVDSFFQRLEQDAIKDISIFFHGGLVDETRGIKAAKAMAENISQIDHHTVGFVWETGLIETFSSNIRNISSKKLYNRLLKMLLKELSKKLGFDQVEGRGERSYIKNSEIENELEKPEPFSKYDQIQQDSGRNASITDSIHNETILRQELEASFRIQIESNQEISDLLLNEVVTLNERTGSDVTNSRGIISGAQLVIHLSKIAFRVIKRFVTKRDHGFYPTIVEELFREFYIAEIGAWIWNGMKEKSELMWASNSNLSGNELHAGRYFLESINSYIEANPHVRINLIGHSAGSIAICNLLETVKKSYPNLKFNKVVFLAPACKVDTFINELVENEDLFKSIRIFTMGDEYEKKDILVPYFYTRSLLYLISGVLENNGKEYDAEILGMERFLLSTYHKPSENLSKATAYLLQNPELGKITFGKTKEDIGEGLGTSSLSHGGFDEDLLTLKSINYFLNSSDE